MTAVTNNIRKVFTLSIDKICCRPFKYYIRRAAWWRQAEILKRTFRYSFIVTHFSWKTMKTSILLRQFLYDWLKIVFFPFRTNLNRDNLFELITSKRIFYIQVSTAYIHVCVWVKGWVVRMVHVQLSLLLRKKKGEGGLKGG